MGGSCEPKTHDANHRMADLVKPKEEGGCAVDEDTICVPGSELTDGESEKTEALEKEQHTKFSDGNLARGNLTAAVLEEGSSDTGEKAKLVSEAWTGPHWNSIGPITRGSSLNENSSWAVFSPVAKAPNSLSNDTSNWAQNLTLDSGEPPVVTSNNQTAIPERESPGVSDQVIDVGSPGWQAFSFGGDGNTTWSETVPRDSDGATPDSTVQPLPSAHRTNDLCQTQTPSVCTASPHHHHPPLSVFRQCFASSVPQNTSGEEGDYERPTECTRGWERIRNSRCGG